MSKNIKKIKNKQPARTNANKANKKQMNKKNIRARRIIAVIIVFLFIFLAIFGIANFSNIFIVKKITVINNSKLTTEEIIQDAGLTIGNKLFRPSRGKIKNKVEENAYIENARITKKLNGEILIDVKERTPSYMLQLEDGFGYINNQGYVLEVTKTHLQLPII